jgi:hypothetical protein
MNAIEETDTSDPDYDIIVESQTSNNDELRILRRVTNTVNLALNYIITIILDFKNDLDIQQALQENLSICNLLSHGNNMFPQLKFQAKHPHLQH